MIEKNWRDLIRPKALDVDKESLTGSYGKFVARPLERGFGLTLGNSLRRVMLSSLQGAAVTGVKIEGQVHEFTAVPDVTEDVAEIILNLKEIRFRVSGTESVTLAVQKEGPYDLKASDIDTSGLVEILNPDQPIATIGKNGKIDMEIKIERGRGYQPAEVNRDEDLPIGWIPVDSFFSPIRKVNYTVNQSRVGKKTDYDKLIFEVWTDGSVDPEDAVAIGSKILKDQLSVFLNFEEEPEPIIEAEVETPPEHNPNLLRSVEELELSVRSANCLQNANIKYIYELVQKTEAEMLKTKNFGRKSLNEIKDILSEMGLGLGMKLDGFTPPETPPRPADTDVDEAKLRNDRINSPFEDNLGEDDNED